MNTTQTEEARLLKIIEGSHDGLWAWDLQTNAVFFNSQSYQLLDIPKNQTVTFDTVLNRILPEDVEPTKIAMQGLITENVRYQVEHHIALEDGSMRCCLCRGQVTERNTSGQPILISGTITDITNLRLVEQRWKDTQNRLDRLIAGSDEGFWEWDVPNDLLYWTDRMFAILGLPVIEGPLNYEFVKQLFAEEEVARIEASLDRTIQEGVPYFEEHRMRHASGKYIHVYAKAKPYFDEHGRVKTVSGMIADITTQKQQELMLKESEERFRTMAEAAPIMIWLTNDQGEVTYINRTYREFFGSHEPDPSELYKLSCVHPDDREKVLDELSVDSKAPRQGEFEFRLRRGNGVYRWVYTIRAPRLDSNGTFVGYIGSSLDITDLKQTEQALHEYAARLEKSNQELDQFVLIASHDLQEPVRKIALFAGFLTASAGDELSQECQDYIERIQHTVVRMQTLIGDLLTLSRITRKGKPFQPTALGEVLRGVLSELENKRQKVQGQIDIGNTLTIDADESQIHQAFVNLVDNALKFHQPDVPPVVQIDVKAVEPNLCEIRITDNGIGFEEKYLPRIFQIFERLHGRVEYEGSGIGLSIVQKIIERHHGTITAQSQPNQGSTFIVRLPIHQAVTSGPLQ